MMSGNQPRPLKKSRHVVAVRDHEDLKKVLTENDVVLVDFYAGWCGPCQKLKPGIHQIADEYQGKAVVAEVNVDKAGKAAEAYGVSSIPDVRIFKSGEEKKAFVGVRSKSDYTEVIDNLISD